jgi:hypothetical protein
VRRSQSPEALQVWRPRQLTRSRQLTGARQLMGARQLTGARQLWWVRKQGFVVCAIRKAVKPCKCPRELHGGRLREMDRLQEACKASRNRFRTLHSLAPKPGLVYIHLPRLACRSYTTAVFLPMSKLKEVEETNVTQYKNRRPAFISTMGDAIDNSEQDPQAGRLPGLSTRIIRRSFLVHVVEPFLRHYFRHNSSFAAW